MEKIKVSKDIILRQVKLEDARLFFEMEQDEEARKNFMSTPERVQEVEKDIRKSLQEYKKKKPSEEKFTIELSGKPVGAIWIDELNRPFSEHKAEIGYCIHKDFRGQGIGSKAIKAVADHAFDKYKLKRLWCFTRTFNEGSIRALEKAGFKLEGVLRKNKFKDGEYLDDVVWAIVK